MNAEERQVFLEVLSWEPTKHGTIITNQGREGTEQKEKGEHSSHGLTESRVWGRAASHRLTQTAAWPPRERSREKVELAPVNASLSALWMFGAVLCIEGCLTVSSDRDQQNSPK